ncbi:bacteriocin [Ligilactobacillus animalis]|nr:bacteriocin [Ligilactobacillus animalis]
MKRLWKWWLAGGIKGNKRYVIFPISEALAIPFGLWFGGDRETSFLQFLTTPKMIIFLIICLVGGGPWLYFLDRVFRINKK